MFPSLTIRASLSEPQLLGDASPSTVGPGSPGSPSNLEAREKLEAALHPSLLSIDTLRLTKAMAAARGAAPDWLIRDAREKLQASKIASDAVSRLNVLMKTYSDKRLAIDRFVTRIEAALESANETCFRHPQPYVNEHCGYCQELRGVLREGEVRLAEALEKIRNGLDDDEGGYSRVATPALEEDEEGAGP